MHCWLETLPILFGLMGPGHTSTKVKAEEEKSESSICPESSETITIGQVTVAVSNSIKF